MGSQHTELLQGSGVNTVVELSKRKPENLYAKMLEINEEKNLVHQLPSAEKVAKWVKIAQELPRVVNYQTHTTFLAPNVGTLLCALRLYAAISYIYTYNLALFSVFFISFKTI
ncbi:MAG: DUF4332 domain-containing protein [Chloroflexota bacterium]